MISTNFGHVSYHYREILTPFLVLVLCMPHERETAKPTSHDSEATDT